MAKRAVVLFSGGLDSTACLYWALDIYEEVSIVSFLYGSKEDKVIKRVSDTFAAKLDIENKVIELGFFKTIIHQSRSSLSSMEENVPVFGTLSELDDNTKTQESAKLVWVPARNLLFVSIAAAIADSFDQPTDIIIGVNVEEGATFPDNTSEFIERMNASLEYGCTNTVQLKAPFVNNTKEEIVKFLSQINADIAFSSSCYNIQGWTKDNKPIHCGTCESCMRRKRAFLKAGIEDPTVYLQKS